MNRNKVIPISTAALPPLNDSEICALLTEESGTPGLDGTNNWFERSCWITADGRHGVVDGAAPPPQDAVVFGLPEDLAAGTADWPLRRLVDVWNQLPGQRRISRFESRSIAAERLWRAIDSLHPVAEEARPEEPPVRRQTKTEQIIELLKAPGGATLAALMQASGWQAHSVRGLLSGKLSKQMGLRICSVRREGERVYALEPAE